MKNTSQTLRAAKGSLSKTQELLYAKEFKKADKAYNQSKKS
ncbi:YfhE family protein [Thalassobacillus pellis]|nr:YfhE family protein [Thalassobacillus pellis]MBM7553829.1 hypothetical protein [Thalassobacillus pellis]